MRVEGGGRKIEGLRETWLVLAVLICGCCRRKVVRSLFPYEALVLSLIGNLETGPHSPHLVEAPLSLYVLEQLRVDSWWRGAGEMPAASTSAL